MEFSSRGFQRNTTPRPAQSSGASYGGDATPPSGDNGDKGSFSKKAFATVRDNKFLTTLSVVLAGALLILFIATIFAIAAKPGSSEVAAVDTDRYQVVALSDGQAYFGKITGLTSKNIVLQDVYYLNNQAGDTANQNNIQLIKRGCEVHGPQDRMIIYREQVNFWENLKDEKDSRVVNAIQQWQKQNPDGQNCEDNTAAPTQQNTSTPTESSDATRPSDDTAAPSPTGTSPQNGDTPTSNTPAPSAPTTPDATE